MKKLLCTLVLCTALNQQASATDWLWYYVYVQTEYMQGPWSGASLLDKQGSYQYLQPKQFEGLFSLSGSGEDIANAILEHLRKETPERYKFKCSLSVSTDTVYLQTKETIADLAAVKNELTASFTLNNFNALALTQNGITTILQLKDVSVPYMDLVLPESAVLPAEPFQKDSLESVHTTAKSTPISASKPEENFRNWLLLSGGINIVLAVALFQKRKR